MKPGQRLTLAALAKELNISQMPVREAVLGLEKDGLIRTTTHRDMMVADLSVEEARQIFPIRAALEALAARIALPHLDDATLAEMERSNDLLVSAIARSDYRSMPDANWAFHRAVLRATGNSLLNRMIEEVWAKSSRFRLGYRLIPGRAENTVTEHAQILAAARDHDLGGVFVFEVLLRTPQALDAVKAMIEAAPEADIGLGTLLTAEDV